ncbi:MAG: zinc-dependent dehydrogenase [Acetivibrionales bacterium]|jgi:L-iditol 2-dehydrogenase
MKAVILSGPNQFAPGTIEKPIPGSGDVVIRMRATAICGTDIRILEGKKTKGVRYPSVIGHEMCGEISEIGSEVSGFAIGDRVSVANVIPCGNCSSCLGGRENACLNRKALGYEFDGGFAEYVLIPRIALQSGNVVKLPDSVSYEEGALIEPLSCCIRGLKNAGTKFGDTVLIVGAGPIGLMHMQLAKIAGAFKTIVSEPNAYRLATAKKLGADVVVDPNNENLEEIVMRETDGLGADVIILAIGVPAMVNQCLKLCKRGGSVNLFAGFSGTGESTIEANLIHYNELNVNGSTAYRRIDYLEAARMVAAQRINLKELVTHKFTIDEFDKAYNVAKSGEGLKIVIYS